MTYADPHALGSFLKDRRGRLDPASFGLPGARRRTPGLRREEVAQRAHVSATWYTWLEQGRGGAPSADVLDRLSRALVLDPAEREHLYLLAQQRPPAVRYRAPEPVSPRLQAVLDALPFSPAMVRTATWDVLAWNRAAACVLGDYSRLPPERRNILRLLFTESRLRANPQWERDMRHVLAAFRLDVARAGAGGEAEALVAELSAGSPEFARLWRDHEVQTHGEGSKHLQHSEAGPLTLDFSSFTVDGRPDLNVVIYTPHGPEDRAKVEALVAADPAG